MLSRILRALKLDASLYNEVEADPSYNNEAYIIVALASLLSGIGGGFGINPNNMGSGLHFSLGGAIIGMILAFIGYLVTAYIVFFVGTRFFGGTADYGEMRRTLGYAYSANFIGIIPCLGIIAIPWAIATYFIATREGLDIDNGKAALTAVISWVIWLVISMILATLGIGAGAGLGALMGS
ncbi:MAG: YIP1 family protein [Chloroflexi bacterium]|nr:YIP1 family protein [Chloroflexota bacterium]